MGKSIFVLHILILLMLQGCSSFTVVDNESVLRLPAEFNGYGCNDLLADFLKKPQASERSFFYEHLLKSSHLKEGVIVPADDLDQKRLLQIRSFFNEMTLNESSSFNERFELLRNFPIGDIAAAPGHRYLRKPEQVKGLVKYIDENPEADFGGDKIILNVLVDSNGKVSSVDLWNAHHRLVAYMENGRRSIKDIPEKNIEILVNGKRENGEVWSHYLSSSGVDWRKVVDYKNVPAGGDIREGTVALPGDVSNYQLGARNTVAQLHMNVFNTERKKMKVGVYFGTFDPIHEGHVGIVKKSIEALGLDEVVIVPNVNPIHKKPTAIKHRNSMIALRIKDEEKINLYTGDSDEIIDKFGRNPFFERIIQIYGSGDLYQIIGDDSFEKLMNQGEIEKSLFRKYVVFRRRDSNIALTSSEKAIIVESEDETGLSSTVVRKKIKAGENPKDDISESQYQYILKNNLYKDD